MKRAIRTFVRVDDAPRVYVQAEVRGAWVTRRVLLPEFVQHVSRVEPGVVAKLPRDYFKRLGEGVDEQLAFAFDAPGVLS